MFLWNDLKANRKLTMQKDQARYWLNKEIQIRKDALKTNWKDNIPDYRKPQDGVTRPGILSGRPTPTLGWQPIDCFYMSVEEKDEDLVYLSKIYRSPVIIRSQMENAWLWGRHLWNETAMGIFKDIPDYKERVRRGISLERDTRKLLENYELDSIEFAPECFPELQSQEGL